MTEDSNCIDNIKLCECGCGQELIRRKWWRPSWMGNEKEGWKCINCSKKEYYIQNRERIRKRKKERYKLTGKK